ncbi:MAG: M23 family metallopeptidase [Acidobacteriota bacterium]
MVLLLALLRVGPEPALQIDPAAPGIGQRTSIVASASEPSRGLSDVRLELLQNDRVFSLAEASFEPRAFWAFWGPRRQEHVLEIEVGRDSLEELVEGTATLRLVAARSGTWLRRPRAATTELELPVRFRPPSSSVLSDLIYVRQGGSEAVVYRVGPTTSEHGVQSGERWFPGYPLPGGGEGEMFALFAVPHDLTDSDQVRLVVRDELGNQSRSAFLDRFTPSPLKRSNIQLNDRFMEKVVAEILDRTPELRPEDSTLETYLKINGELREANRRRLRELGSRSRQEFLWSQPFLQLRNSQVMDSFAARRSYRFEGLQVDTQDHLGFDFASVRRAPVDAANDGIVVLAEYFGIYGNAIVLDHGYGLMTLYAHLSSIEVEEGQTVQRGDSLGRSGETGLAGGDHLHFGVLLQGVPVSPVEWFDAKWIRDRIVRKMPNAFDFDG